MTTQLTFLLNTSNNW